LIHFKEVPPVSNNVRWTALSDRQKSSVLENEILELIKKDAIEEVDPLSLGYYSTFFVVPKKDGGFRPILNLKPLNRYVQYQKFKMETPASIQRYLRQGHWMASVDLTDAYLHVPIHPKHRKFLRFAFNNRVYQFRVLPFGLSEAPRVFTKILAPVVEQIHSLGVQFLPYLDDCLLVSDSQDSLQVNIRLALSILQQAGFIINLKKSFLTPSQDLVFLGLRFRTDLGSVHLPEKKALIVAKSAEAFCQSSTVSALQCLQLLGSMVSCLQVVPFSRLRIRPLQMFLLSRWNLKRFPLLYQLKVPDSLPPLLKVWTKMDWLVSGVPLVPPSPTVTITTDASNLGWGGFLRLNGQDKMTQGRWGTEELMLHINCQELLAVLKTLQAFQSYLKGQVVLVMTDNTSVRQYLNKQGGTKSHTLCALTIKLFNWCLSREIQIVAQHVPGIDNVLADRLSRSFKSSTEWRLHQSVVHCLFAKWDSPNIDLFASGENAHCQTYVSWKPDPKAYHVDALSLDWSGLFAYVFPPIPLIPRVIQKFLQEKPELILIAPFWPRRPWFPILLNMSIADPIRLPLSDKLLTQDKGRLVHPNPGVWSPVAWRLSADTCRIEAYHTRLRKQSLQPGLQPHSRSTSVAGIITPSGAGKGISIPLLHLYLRF
jgi:hypothetical protein